MSADAPFAAAQLFFEKSFVLEPADIRKLAESFAEHVGTPRFEIRCSDGITRRFETANAVSNYDNPLSKVIRSFEISAESEGFSGRASLRLSASENSTVSISLIGDEEMVRGLKDAIDDRLAGMKPWYSWLTRIDFVGIGFFVYVVVYLGLLITVATGIISGGPPKPALDNPRATAISYLVIFGTLFVTIGGGWLCNRIRNAVFPKATFAVGQGESRFRRQETIRWVVIVGFLVSLAAGYVPILLSR